MLKMILDFRILLNMAIYFQGSIKGGEFPKYLSDFNVCHSRWVYELNMCGV